MNILLEKLYMYLIFTKNKYLIIKNYFEAQNIKYKEPNKI